MAKQLTPKEFHKLPKSEKAVLVAKDVLKQISIGRYKPQAGRYIGDLVISDFSDSNAQINEKFDSIKSCTACALGSILLSCTHLGNKLLFSDIGIIGKRKQVGIGNLKNANVVDLFKDIFSKKQLLLIETAFEGFNGSSYGDDQMSDRFGEYLGKILSKSEAKACDKFTEKYNNDYDRLVAICENIIENNGKFKP